MSEINIAYSLFSDNGSPALIMSKALTGLHADRETRSGQKNDNGNIFVYLKEQTDRIAQLPK